MRSTSIGQQYFCLVLATMPTSSTVSSGINIVHGPLGADTGFPKKIARFSKIKIISNLLCNDNEGKIIENINYFSNRSSFIGNPVVMKDRMNNEG